MGNHRPVICAFALALLVGCSDKSESQSGEESPESAASAEHADEEAAAEADEDTAAEADDGTAAEEPSDEAASADEQTYAEAMQIFCDAPHDVDIDNLPPPDKAQALAQHIDDNLDNPEAREMFASLAAVSPEERIVRVSEAAAEAGIDDCAMQGVWERPSR